MRKVFCGAVAALTLAVSAVGPARAVDAQEDQAQLLAEFRPEYQPGKFVLVMKYYGADQQKPLKSEKWVETKQFQPYAAIPNAIAFAGQKTPKVMLLDLQPCSRQGKFSTPNGREGTCSSLWQEVLGDWVGTANVVVCRADLAQYGRPAQAARCYSAMDHNRQITHVDNLDDMLVGLGVITVGKDAEGKYLRQDLDGALKIGGGGYQ